MTWLLLSTIKEIDSGCFYFLAGALFAVVAIVVVLAVLLAMTEDN